MFSFLMTKDKCPAGMAQGLDSRKSPFTRTNGLLVTFFSVVFVPKSVSQENKLILEIWFKQNETIVHGQCGSKRECAQ